LLLASTTAESNTWPCPGTRLSRKPLLRDGKATSGPFPLATNLGNTGFFFPLRQPMLGMSGNPAIRQQGFKGSGVASSDGGNSTQHVR